MNTKIILAFVLLVLSMAFVNAGCPSSPGPGYNVCGGCATWPYVLHEVTRTYTMCTYFGGEGIYTGPYGLVIPANSDTTLSMGGSGLTNFVCENDYGYGWISVDGCGAGKTPMWAYVNATVMNNSADSITREVNIYAPGWLNWNYDTSTNDPSVEPAGYAPIYTFVVSSAGDSKSCNFTYYSKVIGSNIDSIDIPVCFERGTCSAPHCGGTLTCGEVCSSSDIGVYADGCAHYDKCGLNYRATPPLFNDYTSACDNTDSCGNVRNVAPRNSCNLVSPNKICGTETSAQLDDGIDNDCDGKLCRPEVCDGQDNDCDLVNGVYYNYVDNAVYGQASPRLNKPCYTGAAGTENVGLCHGGTQYCSESSSPYWGSCLNQVIPVTESCNGLDDDCDGTKDNGFECVKNVLSGQTDFRNGDCTSACKVCQNNKVTSVSLTDVDTSSVSEAKNLLNQAGSFRINTSAESPNNCLTKYNYELLYSVDGSSWSRASPSTKVGVGDSNFSANGSLSRNSTALTDSFVFTMQYLPVGYKYKVRAQVVDAKDSKNVSGPSYADGAWKESNVITVVNTVPTVSEISVPDRDNESKNVFVNLMPSVDPDVFPAGYPGSQSLSYFSRIWDEFGIPTNPAPGCVSSVSKGEFNPVFGMIYSVPLVAQRTYCADSKVFDGLIYSDCSVSRCSNETPFNPTCADLGFNAVVSSACVNSPAGKTTLLLNVSCSKVSQVINRKWLVGLGGVKVLDSSNFLQTVNSFSALSDCTSDPKVVSVVYDSNNSGVYVVDLNYGGVYNLKPLWCSSVKSFEADSTKGCGAENTLSISDASLIVVLLVLVIVIGVLLLQGKKPVKKTKTTKKKKKK